jgi:cytosine/adenosine deaminase-related metal-dependent hydrolase
MHLAEIAEEAQFTTRLAGPIRGFLKRHRVWDRRIPCPGLSPVAYAAVTGVLRSASLLAHVNYATDEELDLIAAAGAHVAYCPRTHDAFGHQPHRFREMIDRGINVCIGTDSLASNPSLSVLEELRFLHRRHPDLPAGLLLAMGTIHGARGLGLADAVGALAPGMQADLTVVPLDPHGPTDPVENLLQSNLQPTATCIAGEWVGPAAST